MAKVADALIPEGGTGLFSEILYKSRAGLISAIDNVNWLIVVQSTFNG